MYWLRPRLWFEPSGHLLPCELGRFTSPLCPSSPPMDVTPDGVVVRIKMCIKKGQGSLIHINCLINDCSELLWSECSIHYTNILLFELVKSCFSGPEVTVLEIGGRNWI